MSKTCRHQLEMISVDRSLFNYFDDILFDMGLTPDDLKMPQPKYLLKVINGCVVVLVVVFDETGVESKASVIKVARIFVCLRSL